MPPGLMPTWGRVGTVGVAQGSALIDRKHSQAARVNANAIFRLMELVNARRRAVRCAALLGSFKLRLGLRLGIHDLVEGPIERLRIVGRSKLTGHFNEPLMSQGIGQFRLIS